MKIVSILTERKSLSQTEGKGWWISEHELQRQLLFLAQGNENQPWPLPQEPTTWRLHLFSEFLTRHERSILCNLDTAPMMHSVSAYSEINPLLFTQSLSPVYRESPLWYTSTTETDPPALCLLQLDLRLESCPLWSPGKYSPVGPGPPHVPDS